MKNKKPTEAPAAPKYPGIATAVDGSQAVVEMETAASEAAGAYPITPSTQMGEGWAAALAAGKHNVNGRKLIFFEPEGEHAAAAVTAGMAMTGLRATNFSSGQGIAYMHESLYPAVGKRLTYVLNVAARAMTKHALNVHAGHDDYHAVDDTGFFQLFAKNPQEIADLTLIAHRIAELSLNPGLCAQDGFLTSHVIESVRLPERELIKEYLGDPSDIIDSPTPAQRWVFGEKRRRIPEMFDLDYPSMIGVVQNQDSYNQGVAAQRPFYFDHIQDLTDQAMAEYEALTGRYYARVMGYRLDDAEYVIVGQGSVVTNVEVVCDYMRDKHGLKVGVLNVTMFRPFPTDLMTRMLRGKKAVTVLERTDQPLAVDAPLLKEIRAAMSKGLENHRAGSGQLPYTGVEACPAEQIPEFFSGCFGLGSRDIQPGQIVAAIENMLEGGKKRRQFYLGIDFIRAGTQVPKLQIWQEQLLEGYPDLAELALQSKEDLNLLPEGAVTIRIHSVGGWGAITTGKNVAMTAADLFGLNIQANPKYGSEKKGQPTTFYATLAEAPLRLNCELMHVNVVLAPDPNVFRHSNPLAGMEEGGIFIIQSDLSQEEFWNSLPGTAQRAIRSKNVSVYLLDGFKIAAEEASDPSLRYRMQGAAFMGAFFNVAPLVDRYGLEEEKLFDGIRAQLKKKFGHLGERVVEDNVRVIRRGYDEIRHVDTEQLAAEKSDAGIVPQMPDALDGTGWRDGIGNPGRFWEQVCHLYKTGEDGIADPFAAISAIPAATSTIRDMTDVRFEIPEFIAANCTGCGQCWVQCPDTAIPGVVTEIDQVMYAAINAVSNGQPFDRFRQVVPHIAREARRIMQGVPFTTFGDIMSTAYKTVTEKLDMDPERRRALDSEFGPVYSALAEFPLAKTAPFFDMPEGQEKGTGGLLSITVNPETCKGCNVCVEVCPDEALITVKQDETNTERLRRNWKLWERLPETPDRYINVSDIDEGIGVLSSLLLKKYNYRSMMGGDGSCMGCGEKTAIHLVLAAVNAIMIPRVEKYVLKLDDLISRLDAKARDILASDADLDAVGKEQGEVEIPLEESKQKLVERINSVIHDLKDLKWRYTEGPSGKGRSSLGMTNATGCSSVWGSTYPYNPYPFPWTNHLFQDAPSIAIGIFEGHMRKMADGFVAVRRAELELNDEYDADVHEKSFSTFDWREFDDEEFGMCPPIFAVGGDGAMLDIGFQNLSRLLASGKPLRVIVLDTQVYSNTGGQACTSGFLGQVSDMAAYGAGQHGKEEMRKELSLIAMAHGRVFVVQSTQAAASHLVEGVLRGLQVRGPAIFALHTPCPPEHGLGDDQATRASRLAVESRAYPVLIYDPFTNERYLSDQLSLDGNPSLEDTWPSYELTYLDESSEEQRMELPITIADWAATETRFQKHFKGIKGEIDEDELVLFHEYLELSKEDRQEKTAFIYQIDDNKRLTKLLVSHEIAELADDRLLVWSKLKQMAGLEIPPSVRDTVEYELEEEFNKKADALQTEYSAKLAELKARYPALVARKLAEGLVRAGNGGQTVADLLAKVQEMPLAPLPADVAGGAGELFASAPAPGATAVAEAPAATAVAAAPVAVEEEEEGLAMEPYIESARCTTCDECTKLNNKMFAYNEKKQAFIKDAKAGTFKQLVQGAEKCPVRIIHPGTPLNPREKDLDKWVKRAEPFN
jgi:pyruvate-ferredoxin/flavodoxin oxidoreductase